MPRAVVYGIDQWAVITAVLGFGSRHLRDRRSAALTYLTEATFPLYLAHQTVLVAAVWIVRPAGLPAGPEALLLALSTFVGSLIIYEGVKRVNWARPWWGLKPLNGHPEPPARPSTLAPYRRRRRLLWIGTAAPIAAMAIVGVAALAYPGFDNATQYLSELGGETARAPIIFNAGVFLAGLMAGIAGLGFGLAVHALSGARVAGVVIAVVFVVAGAGLSMSTLYPWPDPRHMVINLGLGIQLAPLLLLWGLSSRRDVPRLKFFLLLIFMAMLALTILTKHLLFAGLVNDANVGWWERAYAIVLVGWVGVAAWALERKLRPQEAALPAAPLSAVDGAA